MTAQAMMRVSFKRPKNFHNIGRSAMTDLRKTITTRLVASLWDMQRSILETPVYTGKTLVNFRWSLGSPNTTVRPAVKDPELPGKTSEMARGSEPRRTANAAVVEQEFLALLQSVQSNPFQDIYLNNNVENFSDVEYGTYATEGRNSRTPPAGMTRRGETLLEYNMKGFLRRVA